LADTFSVRRATRSDYQQMRALLAEVDELHRLHLPWMFQEPAVEPRPQAFFEQLIVDEHSALLVAEADSRLVGVATVQLRTAPNFPVFIAQTWGVLDNIAVAQAYRRRGVGSALIRDAERWVRGRGASWLELGVYEFNDEARAFYQSLGYTPVLSKLHKPF
jgi:ribosomal protein S18 acetylase RimI-like enzyme